MAHPDELVVLTADKIKAKYTQPLDGIIIGCIKHIRRYNQKELPRDIWVAIFWNALKGIKKEEPLDISQRLSIYEYFKDKKIDNPYIKQFMKETKEAQCSNILE